MIKLWQSWSIQVMKHILRSINLVIVFWIRENCPSSGRNLLLLLLPICKICDETECNNCRGILLLPSSYKMLSNILSKLTLYVDEIIGNHHVDFDVIDQLLIKLSTFSRQAYIVERSWHILKTFLEQCYGWNHKT